jgi:hypothetical protein
MRFAVLCKGVLRGMGHEAPCELLATKTVVPESSRAIYSHCAIIEAPTGLPDGDYEVEFSGEVGVSTLRHGCWMVGRLLPHTYEEVASFYANQTPSSSSQADDRERQKSIKPAQRPGDSTIR